jgi:hypothetical protein
MFPATPSKRPRRSSSTRSRSTARDEPPQLSPEIRLSKIIRYQRSGNAAGGNIPITAGNLLNTFVVAITAATTSRLIRSLRVVKVEAWQPPIALGAGAQALLSITGTGLGPENVSSDLAMGIRPAHIVWKPLPLSQVGLWLESGEAEANGIFVFDAAVLQGTIVDVTIEFILADIADSAVAGPVPAGATAGQLYVPPLDGNIGAGALFVPVDYTLLP